MLIKIIRFAAFTVFFFSYASKGHNTSNSFRYILRGGLTFLFGGAYNLIGSVVIPVASFVIILVGYIFWFTGEWAYTWGKGESLQAAAAKLI